MRLSDAQPFLSLLTEDRKQRDSLSQLGVILGEQTKVRTAIGPGEFAENLWRHGEIDEASPAPFAGRRVFDCPNRM
jgi:hypothetical protein